MGSVQQEGPQPSEVPHSRSARHEFSPEQIAKYLAYIHLPEEHATSPILKDGKFTQQEEHAVPFLAALMRYHMAKIPFENLALHYSYGRHATLDLNELYDRMVESGRGRGGYCFQQNAFFSTILKSIGFEVMTTAARVNSACGPGAAAPNYPGPSYDPWNHAVSIVAIGSKDYLVDVGMNAWGPVMPLEIKKTTEATSISPRTVRLVRGCIPEHVSRRESNQMWQLEVRNGDQKPWIPTYCFPMIEFLPVDFFSLNWYISTNKASWFTQATICGRLILSDDGTEIIGDETMFGSTLLRRIHGEVKEHVECKSEKERIALLEKHFGLNLLSYEQAAITGTAAQIS